MIADAKRLKSEGCHAAVFTLGVGNFPKPFVIKPLRVCCIFLNLNAFATITVSFFARFFKIVEHRMIIIRYGIACSAVAIL